MDQCNDKVQDYETSVFNKKKGAFNPSKFVRSESMPRLIPSSQDTKAAIEVKLDQPTGQLEPDFSSASMVVAEAKAVKPSNNIEALMNRIKARKG